MACSQPTPALSLASSCSDANAADAAPERLRRATECQRNSLSSEWSLYQSLLAQLRTCSGTLIPKVLKEDLIFRRQPLYILPLSFWFSGIWQKSDLCLSGSPVNLPQQKTYLNRSPFGSVHCFHDCGKEPSVKPFGG